MKTECEHCYEMREDVHQRIPGDRNAAHVCDDCHELWLDGRTLEEAIAEETGDFRWPRTGMRIQLRGDVDTLVIEGRREHSFPNVAEVGEVGTVVRVNRDEILVQLDEVPDDLPGWTGLIWWEPSNEVFNPFWELVVEVNIPPPSRRLRYGITLRIAVEVEQEEVEELGLETALARAACEVIGSSGLDRDHVAEARFERVVFEI